MPRLEEAIHVAHFHNHRLQLGVVLDCHLAILSAKAWWDTVEIIMAVAQPTLYLLCPK